MQVPGDGEEHLDRRHHRTLMRLIHNDCREAIPDLPRESVDAVITDPPYGIDYASAWRKREERFDTIDGDGSPAVSWLDDAYSVVSPGGCVLVFCRWDVQEAFRKAIDSSGFEVRSQVIWDRGVHGLGDLNGQFAPRHDVIWFATKGTFSFPNGRPVSVIKHKRVAPSDLVHPTQKPVGLMEKLISYVVGGGTILDPFMGSGSTGVAACRRGEDFVGIEMNDDYFELAEERIRGTDAVSRLEDFT